MISSHFMALMYKKALEYDIDFYKLIKVEIAIL
eukprot:Gb_21842 [translate_table: standard]